MGSAVAAASVKREQGCPKLLEKHWEEDLPPCCQPGHIWLQQQSGQAGLGGGPRASSSFAWGFRGVLGVQEELAL